jgi:hypothetical protein
MGSSMILRSTLESMGFPPTFPIAAYDAVGDHIRKYAVSREWKAWAMGWKGVAYRYRAAFEDHEAFVAALHPPEDGDQRFRQERSFYGLLTNGMSVISCCSYAVYAMVSLVAPTVFPIATAKDLRFYPEDVARKLASAPSPFQTDAITVALTNCIQDAQYSEMKELRNALDHRGMPGRLRELGGPDYIPSNLQDLPDQWMVDLRFDTPMSQRLLDWLTAQLTSLLGAAASFGATHL